MFLRHFPLILALIPTLVFGEESEAIESEEADGAMIEGSWRLIRAEQGGEKTPQETFADLDIVYSFTEGSYTLEGPVNDHGLYVCNDSSEPKTVDIISSEGENKDRAIQAIYKVDGNELTICYDFDDKRPAGFSTADSETIFMAVYKRSE
jgi:uncharacterized protein (TIGR03067 family)